MEHTYSIQATKKFGITFNNLQNLIDIQTHQLQDTRMNYIIFINRLSVNVLKQLVKVVVDVNDEKEIREYNVSDLKFRKKKKRDNDKIQDEELKELEELEKKEGKSKFDD